MARRSSAGSIVAILGWIAIAAGWIQSDGGSITVAALAPAPLPQPAVQQSSGKGQTVNQIYQADSPGVVFIQAHPQPQAPSPFNPFGGGSGGGTATGSGFVIDHDGPHPHQRPRRGRSQQDRGHPR